MTQVLEIDTSKSLYKPIEVKIDGKLFKVRELNVDALERIQALQVEAVAGSISAIKGILSEALDGPVELLGKLNINQVTDIVGFAINGTLKPEAKEKNARRPGPVK